MINKYSFKKDDDVFVVDNGRWRHKNEIVIQKRRFERYTSPAQDFLVFSGATSMQIATWAVFSTHDEAAKFSVAYIIKTECFNEKVDRMDGEKEYKFLEEHHPELIFKYMSYLEDESVR